MISFVCGGCQKPYDLSDNLAGAHVRCKQCGAELVVPLGVSNALPSTPASLYDSRGSIPIVYHPVTSGALESSAAQATPPVRAGHRSNSTALWLVFGGIGAAAVVSFMFVGAFALIVAASLRRGAGGADSMSPVAGPSTFGNEMPGNMRVGATPNGFSGMPVQRPNLPPWPDVQPGLPNGIPGNGIPGNGLPGGGIPAGGGFAGGGVAGGEGPNQPGAGAPGWPPGMPCGMPGRPGRHSGGTGVVPGAPNRPIGGTGRRSTGRRAGPPGAPGIGRGFRPASDTRGNGGTTSGGSGTTAPRKRSADDPIWNVPISDDRGR